MIQKKLRNVPLQRAARVFRGKGTAEGGGGGYIHGRMEAV